MSGARRRLLSAAISYLAGIGTRIAVQLATLPILFASWPSERVGTWMLIFALPSYLALAGQAFSGAGGNVALAASREGKLEEARAAFRSSWIWGTVFSLILVGVLLAAAFLAAEDVSRSTGFTGQGELRASILWLSVYILALVQAALMVVPLRVSGRYPVSTMALNLASLTEIAVLAACVVSSQSFVLLASALAILRLVTAVGLALCAWHYTPELFVRPAASLRPSLRALFRPSLAFMVLPLVNALNLQGYTLLVGLAYGAAVVAGFVAIRVIVRAIDLVTSVLFAIQFFEAGYLPGDKRALQRRQLATMTSLTAVALIGFTAMLLFGGDWLTYVFTAGQTQFDPTLALVLLVAGALRAFATTPLSIIAAENEHGGFARAYLLASLAALLGAAALAATGAPLVVAAAMLIVAELIACWLAFARALDLLQWSAASLMASLAKRERVEDIVQLLRFLGHGR